MSCATVCADSQSPLASCQSARSGGVSVEGGCWSSRVRLKSESVTSAIVVDRALSFQRSSPITSGLQSLRYALLARNQMRHLLVIALSLALQDSPRVLGIDDVAWLTGCWEYSSGS